MSNTDTQPANESSAESEVDDTDPSAESNAEKTDEPVDATAAASAASGADPELTAKIDLLAAENRRLRELVADSQRSRYRSTALALCGVGLCCGLLGYLTPTASTVLFALGGTGLFGGVLTYFLTPERFISADVGHRVYTATAESFERLCADLGLSDRRVYVASSTDESAEDGGCRLFVPQTEQTTVPEPSALDSALVVTDTQRGLSLRPTGSRLFQVFETALTEPLGSTPETICAQLSDALVEEFELAQSVEYDTDSDAGRISVRITDALYGDGTRFDHPVVSLLAVGLSTGLETPVETTISGTEPLVVTFRWDTEADEP